MRLATLFCLLIALTGITAAQDTSFPVGPQYLITSDSPMFLHSIATPTLSLSAPDPSVSAPATEAPAEPASASATLQFQPDLSRIYWRGPEVNKIAGESVSQNLGEIAITSAPLPGALPASILDTGVTGMTDAQSLRQRGYGVSVGETAAFWKAHKPHASRHYTNADVQRLHPS